MKKLISIVIAISLFCAPIAAAYEPEGDIFAVDAHGLEYDGYLFELKDGAACSAELYSPEISQVSDSLYFAEDLSVITANWNSSDIEYIEPNYIVTLYDAPNDPLFDTQWGIGTINASAAWALGYTGEGVRVAVIDTGVIPDHEDLNYDYIETGKNYFDGGTDTTDTAGHGTIVTGIIAAQRNNGKGIAGTTDKVTIIPLKAFSTNSTSTDKIVSAVRDAVDVYECDVINMSFGVDIYSTALSSAVTYAASKNVLMIAAAGNSGGTSLCYPAAFPEVIGVGAVSKDLTISKFSQHNSSVFVVAPGDQITSLSYNNSAGYSMNNAGTSFSTPYVTALAAIAKSIDTDITIDEFEGILILSSTDLSGAGYDTYYGYGLINIEEAISVMSEKIDVLKYSDISTHWAASSIIYVIMAGLFNGTSGTEFSPDISMTRAMFVTVLGRLYENSGGIIDSADSPFDDTQPGTWYSKYVSWALGNGIISGYGNNLFGPGDSITREQAAVIMYNYAVFRGYDVKNVSVAQNSRDGTLASYTDAGAISRWAEEEMEWTVSEGIITGISSTTLSPDGLATRAQVSVIMQRCINLLETAA